MIPLTQCNLLCFVHCILTANTEDDPSVHGLHRASHVAVAKRSVEVTLLGVGSANGVKHVSPGRVGLKGAALSTHQKNLMIKKKI